MYLIKSKKNLDYICFIISYYDEGDDYNANEYEYSSTDELDATKFEYKQQARDFLNQFNLAADYKIVKIK